MGDFLSTPNEEKHSIDDESGFVSKKRLMSSSFNRLNTVHVECKDGEREWKTHIYPTYPKE